MCKLPRRGCYGVRGDETTTSPSSPSTVWSALILRLTCPSRPKPRDRLGQRVVDWTDVLYYLVSRVVYVAALIQLVLHGSTVLHHL